MDHRQIAILGILGGAMGLFLWGRWRYDVVALLALLAGVGLGVVDAGTAFNGFAHPAVITVAAVLVISRALTRSGAITPLADFLAMHVRNGLIYRITLLGGSSVVSAFVNNVAALTMFMPVASSTCKRTGIAPSSIFMPLAFCTMLGGMTTMVGTPPNIIVANFRATATGTPFGMFDFTSVGLSVAVAGILFVTLFAPWLIPRHRTARPEPEELFDINNYFSELEVGAGSPLVGQNVGDFAQGSGLDIQILGLFRGERRMWGLLRLEVMQPGDVLLVNCGADVIRTLTERHGLQVVGEESLMEQMSRADIAVAEAVVKPDSAAAGGTPLGLKLRSRYGINLLAVGREGQPVRSRLRDVVLRPGDVLLLQGDAQELPEVMSTLGLLPLASRKLHISARRAALPLSIFAIAIALIGFGVLSAPLSLAGAAVVMVLLEIVPAREMYDAVDWPVVVMLAAMIPVGEALDHTGAAGLVGAQLARLGSGQSPLVMMALLLVITMFLSDVMNNAATAVVMAPVGLDLASRVGASPDPFLMAVAIGASCAFLTPVGHQNNTLVMGPGGYRFGDYWRLGLPLEAVIAGVSIPLIPLFWPF
ncbi:MAG: SLC13 family permease [Nitrospirota bacterium]|nr:SLC13 family permease [Nitrospirota bacterium]